jgi:hypothetical protein
MLSLMGPGDLQLWLAGKYLCGKDWSRGFLCNSHTFEDPLKLFEYFWGDTDGVSGSDRVNAPAAVLRPGPYDTSLRDKKYISNSLPFTATHHALLIERQAARDDVTADDIYLEAPASPEGNLLSVEARCWYQLFLEDDQNPADEGMLTEFPPGYGPEGDFTTADTALFRTGMNNLSAVRALPLPVDMTRVGQSTMRAVITPVHGLMALEITGGAAVGAVGLRAMVHWFKKLA